MLGNIVFKMVIVQGEKVIGNGIVIQYKLGGIMVYQDVVVYKLDMEYIDLKIIGKVYKGGKEKKGKFEDQVIVKGMIIILYFVNKDFCVIYVKDEFKCVFEYDIMVIINFEVVKFVVCLVELKDKDIKDLGVWLVVV